MNLQGQIEFIRHTNPKLSLVLPIEYELLQTEAEEPKKDKIAHENFCLRLPAPIIPGSRVKIQVSLADACGPRKIEVIGTAVWANNEDLGEKNTNKIGISLDTVDPIDLQYLQQFEYIWLKKAL
jgi:hypothetical protein